MTALSLLVIAGCYSQQQYDQALQRSADLQTQLDQAKAKLETRTEELRAEQSRASDAAAAKEKATRSIAETVNENQQLRKNLDAARRELESAATSLAKEHAELQKALDSQKEARSRMEQELADRNVQIDILANKVRRLERELERLRRPPTSTPTTQVAR